MEIAILTSSRADFGFYKPLLNLLKKQTKINYNLIVFGTHLSPDYGYTIDNIKASGYRNISEVKAIPNGDKAIDIVKTIGNTHLKFADFGNSIILISYFVLEIDMKCLQPYRHRYLLMYQ